MLDQYSSDWCCGSYKREYIRTMGFSDYIKKLGKKIVNRTVKEVLKDVFFNKENKAKKKEEIPEASKESDSLKT